MLLRNIIPTHCESTVCRLCSQSTGVTRKLIASFTSPPKVAFVFHLVTGTDITVIFVLSSGSSLHDDSIQLRFALYVSVDWFVCKISPYNVMLTMHFKHEWLQSKFIHVMKFSGPCCYSKWVNTAPSNGAGKPGAQC